VFKRYKPLSEISDNIVEEFIAKKSNSIYNEPNTDVSKIPYKRIISSGLTFFMSTDTGLKRTGLLSLFPALSTGIKLYSEMPESENKTELLSKIIIGVEAVFRIIYRVEEGNWYENPNRIPVFDASPYESDAFYTGKDAKDFNGRSYIDSISWAVTLFLKIINLVDENEQFIFDEVYRKEARDLIKWCLNYVNNAVLTIDVRNEKDGNKDYRRLEAKDEKEEKKDYKRPIGWNFSKIVTKTAESQSSLYFTYAAASIYVAIYEEYKDFIDNWQTLNRACDKAEKEGKKLLEKNDNGTILLGKKSHFKQAEDAITAYESTLEDKEDIDGLRNALKALKEYSEHNKNKFKRKVEDFDFWLFAMLDAFYRENNIEM
jgi:hypothetical protein